ncbi:MAG TPA: NUDIX hydrolase [Candidatus Hydrogenedentes bacterium]|nr:NUDIX hydrolase [Candidatus Hydrogenedentota bacterium]HPG66361.1 NUDIX hydrolase [Candidatus Hydrogenedentota bacterium]
MEMWIDKKNLYEGEVVALDVGHVRLDDGVVALREVIRHPGGVAIVPFHHGHVVLIRQYRIAIGAEILEIPAGKLEGAEDPVRRAMCELEEEGGYRAGRLVPVGSVYASVGYTSEEIRLFLAFDLEPIDQRPEEDERITIVEIPISEIRAQLADNEIKDAKTVVGLGRLLKYLEEHGRP